MSKKKMPRLRGYHRTKMGRAAKKIARRFMDYRAYDCARRHNALYDLLYTFGWQWTGQHWRWPVPTKARGDE